jgi:hypothetical protein
MTKTIPPARRIQLLLNTLLGEKYVRRSLLREVVDELALGDDHADAVSAGRALLERLESGIDQGEYETKIARLCELTSRAYEGQAYPADAAE